MPTKHIVKQFDAPAYYHVFNRASGERQLFHDDADRVYFISLLQKYLLELADTTTDHEVFDIRVVAYCLMGSHFHLQLFQESNPEAMLGYMKAIGVSYAMYYNKKYKSKGHVFQSNYRASLILSDSYLELVSRYVHLNPRYYKNWPWSSYKVFLGKREAGWVHPELVLDTDDKSAIESYENFVDSYAHVDRRIQSNEISDYLAD